MSNLLASLVPGVETTLVVAEVEDYKGILCRQCNKHYFYPMKVRSSAEEQNLAFIGSKAATNRAKIAAYDKLRAKFAKQDDPVPCPECGQLNLELLPKLQRVFAKPKLHSSVFSFVYGVIFFVLAVFLALIGWFFGSTVVFFAIGGLLALIAVVSLVGGFRARAAAHRISMLGSDAELFRTLLESGRSKAKTGVGIVMETCIRSNIIRERQEALEAGRAEFEEGDLAHHILEAEAERVERLLEQLRIDFSEAMMAAYFDMAREAKEKAKAPSPWARK